MGQIGEWGKDENEMNAGHDNGFPDYSGGNDPYGQQGGYRDDPYASGSVASDPYANASASSDPYADPYALDPLLTDGYASGALQAQPPAGPHPMGPPQYGAFQAPLPSSSAAITGFVLGLVGLVMCGGLTSPFGIIFSAKGMKETAPTASPMMGGRGLAIAGLVISLIGLLPLLLMLFYIVVIVISIVGSATA